MIDDHVIDSWMKQATPDAARGMYTALRDLGKSGLLESQRDHLMESVVHGSFDEPVESLAARIKLIRVRVSLINSMLELTQKYGKELGHE